MHPTTIEWTEYASNPLRAVGPHGREGWACVKVSPACAHCYAETLNRRFGTTRRFTPAGMAGVTFQVSTKALTQLYAHKTPRKVFVGDMTDLFQDGVSDALLDRLFGGGGAPEAAGVFDCPWHTIQLLTKRPERMWRYLTSRYPAAFLSQFLWVGASVENRRMAAARLPWLLKMEAAVRFLSVEPLLEDWGAVSLRGVHWCIIGCESGRPRRPSRVPWVVRLIEQCRRDGVAPFVKQWEVNGQVTGDMTQFPKALQVREWPVIPI